jgi:hypothetical protein
MYVVRVANLLCTEGLIINSKWLKHGILKKKKYAVCLPEIEKLARLQFSFRISAYKESI